MTADEDALDAVLYEANVRAANPFGAIHDFAQLRESQLVACFSAISLDNLQALADRHGQYGLALNGAWMRSRGARPVTYLPRDSPTQQEYFELVKRSAFTRDFDPDNPLWRHTPFIDYPRLPQQEGGPSTYDWRWEQEWRVKGDLSIDSPARVEFLVAPEEAHSSYHRMWDRELDPQGLGGRPPIIDSRWSLEDKESALQRGAAVVVDEPVSLTEQDKVIDTASPPFTLADEQEADREGSLAEWVGWLEEMERDDI